MCIRDRPWYDVPGHAYDKTASPSSDSVQQQDPLPQNSGRKRQYPLFRLYDIHCTHNGHLYIWLCSVLFYGRSSTPFQYPYSDIQEELCILNILLSIFWFLCNMLQAAFFMTLQRPSDRIERPLTLSVYIHYSGKKIKRQFLAFNIRNVLIHDEQPLDPIPRAQCFSMRCSAPKGSIPFSTKQNRETWKVSLFHWCAQRESTACIGQVLACCFFGGLLTASNRSLFKASLKLFTYARAQGFDSSDNINKR